MSQHRTIEILRGDPSANPSNLDVFLTEARLRGEKVLSYNLMAAVDRETKRVTPVWVVKVMRRQEEQQPTEMAPDPA